MRKWHIAVMAAALLAQGCSTNLQVTALKATDSTPAQGAQYSLPFARYKILVARVLQKCEINNDTQAAELHFHVGATAEQFFEPDPSQTFVIDTRSLSHVLKTSELSWELYEGC